MKIAGLDIGTTGCKLTVFDENGNCLDRAYCDYPVVRGKSEHEVNPCAIKEGVITVLRELSEKHPDISGIGVTSFGETFVMTNEKGEPLLPSMLYTDPRGEEECSLLIKELDEAEITRISGLKPHEMYSISKIMWVKAHQPEVFQKAKHIFLIQDYIVFLLTGTAQIDYSLAARTMAFDIRELTWSDRILAAAGVDASLFSKPVPIGTAAGTITTDISEKTGLSENTLIVTVSHDQMSAAVGSGTFDSNQAVDGAGTVECITALLDDVPDMQIVLRGGYAIAPYVIPGKYVCYAFSYTGGALVQWCVDTLGKQEKEHAQREGRKVNQILERMQGTDGPTGLLVLPHFAGAGTPYMDMGSKGAVVGLTVASTFQDIYLACMEGVVYEMKLNVEKLKEAGISFQMLRATGGGANSQCWMQMKADILEIPVQALDASDAGTVGSAMLTGIALGCFESLEDAAAHMVRSKEVYEPRQEQCERYRKVYQRYRRLYQAIRPLL
jgi:xylulokinase